MKKIILIDPNRDIVTTEEQFLDVLSDAYTLGYLKAMEKFAPDIQILEKEEIEHE